MKGSFNRLICSVYRAICLFLQAELVFPLFFFPFAKLTRFDSQGSSTAPVLNTADVLRTGGPKIPCEHVEITHSHARSALCLQNHRFIFITIISPPESICALRRESVYLVRTAFCVSALKAPLPTSDSNHQNCVSSCRVPEQARRFRKWARRRLWCI